MAWLQVCGGSLSLLGVGRVPGPHSCFARVGSVSIVAFALRRGRLFTVSV